MNDFTEALTTPYPINAEQVAFFRKNGYIKLKQVLSPEVIEAYNVAITQQVQELNTLHLPMEERNTYQKAFLQVMNLWTKSEIVKTFVMSPRLGQIAADLLEVSGVRLYHDQALYKEPGGGITPWHADQFYWPMSSDRTITAWIPLQATPLEMGALAFAASSHTVDLGRSLPISDESEKQIQTALQAHDFAYVETPYDLGEVSYHLGWTFHRAGANTSQHPRSVMTMIYMDENMQLAQPANANQERDWHNWCPGAQVGQVIDTPLNPVTFSHQA
jgi:ectoine hydroxylase-related dioxygenase (phytanoyl-CoA dioxygenase family)